MWCREGIITTYVFSLAGSEVAEGARSQSRVLNLNSGPCMSQKNTLKMQKLNLVGRKVSQHHAPILEVLIWKSLGQKYAILNHGRNQAVDAMQSCGLMLHREAE